MAEKENMRRYEETQTMCGVQMESVGHVCHEGGTVKVKIIFWQSDMKIRAISRENSSFGEKQQIVR
jgi:hypothetical protein